MFATFSAFESQSSGEQERILLEIEKITTEHLETVFNHTIVKYEKVKRGMIGHFPCKDIIITCNIIIFSTHL